FMRAFYASLKATTFCWLLLIQPLPQLWPDVFTDWMGFLRGIGAVLVYASVLTCLLRGLPVIWEFAYQEKDSFAPKRVKSE
ncbi:MAG: hypothetical protein ACREQ1_08930, partial [Woeseiaceae bacterium]